MVFLSYALDHTLKEQAFFVRSFDLNTNEYQDYKLNTKPVKLVASETRLFVFTWDENTTEKYALTVLNYEENTELLKIDMGLDVGTMFKKTDDDIVISYPDSHTTLDFMSLNHSYTRYTAGREPNFFTAENTVFDLNENMYYVRNESSADQDNAIAAVHNFNENLTVLYFFENFLNVAQLQVEYDVKDATAVSFDSRNNLILIGYQKNKKTGGGVIRITPAPDLKFVNNFDLSDVPFLISFVE